MMVTCYVLEDGSSAHPRDVSRDAKGGLRHKDGRAVAMRGDVPRTRSVDTEAKRAAEVVTPAEPSLLSQETEASRQEETQEPKPEETKELKPQSPRRGYRTRESKAD